MKVIKLKNGEVDFLKNECRSDVLDKYLSNNHYDEKSSSFLLMLNNEEIEIIADELLLILNEKGLNENGEINYLGKYIDDLIDKFNQYHT